MSAIAAARTTAPTLPTLPVDEDFDGAYRRKQRIYRIAVLTVRLAIVAVLLGGWQGLSGPVIDPFWVSSPEAIGDRLIEWTRDGTLAANAQATLLAMAIGLVLGSAAGIVAGFLLGRVRLLGDVFNPFIIAMNSLPKLALAPLFILWFGIGLQAKVVMTALVCFFLVFYNTFAGARDTDSELLGVVAVLGANSRQRLTKVILPYTLAWILTGLRLAVPYSLLGVVVSEITASNEGLGHLLKTSANTFDTAGTFAAIAVLVVVALVLNIVVTRAESLSSRWK
ncbi:ABC transporter permease [Nocardia sp. NPDC047648]|uniref:ABC transporter permease n=1 Tax=Nocardia sp. NPDC047648 TaxID=3155625 RepID=UPI0033DF8657